MVLGLGITRLLLGVITVFRIRRRATVDWIPLAWAFCLFLTQLEYWWAITQLPLVKPSFSFFDFVSLVVLTLMLFLAAALLLPNRTEDEQAGLRDYFEHEGRYALFAMAGFSSFGYLANGMFFGAPWFSFLAILGVPLMVLPVVGFFRRDRTSQVIVIGLYLPLLLVDTLLSAGV